MFRHPPPSCPSDDNGATVPDRRALAADTQCREPLRKRATPVGYQQPPRGTSISRWMSTTLSCVSVGSQVLFCAFCGGGPGQATGSFPGTGVEPTLFAVSTIRAW